MTFGDKRVILFYVWYSRCYPQPKRKKIRNRLKKEEDAGEGEGMSFIPRPQEIYKHFKGNLYQVVAVATHSETGEQLVVYQALYGDFKTYARPLSMFTDRVDKEKYPDVVQEFRFELQGDQKERQKAESEPVFVDVPDVSDGEGEGLQAHQERQEEDAGLLEQDSFVKDAVQKPEEEGMPGIDPLVMEFLDADTYGEKLNILAALRHRITDSMINTMAVACDVEVEEGNVEERCDSLKRCLLTREKYECSRLM